MNDDERVPFRPWQHLLRGIAAILLVGAAAMAFYPDGHDLIQAIALALIGIGTVLLSQDV